MSLHPWLIRHDKLSGFFASALAICLYLAKAVICSSNEVACLCYGWRYVIFLSSLACISEIDIPPIPVMIQGE